MAEVGGAGKDRTHLPHAESPAPGAGALDAGFALWTELLSLFVQATLKDTTGAGGAALLGVDLGVLAVDDTLNLRLGDDAFLTAPGYAGFGGGGPGHGAVIRSTVQHATFTPLAAGSGLFHHQSAVLRDQRTFLLFAVGLPLQTHAGDAGVVRDVGDVEDLSFVLTAGLRTCN